MKQLAVLFLFAGSWMYSTVCAQRIPVFELHFSGNHPLGSRSSTNNPTMSSTEVRTFYGGGFGANLVFRDTRVVSFKTGLETNFFHTWNKSVYVGKMASSTDVHYRFWNLSIPLMLRVHAGERVKFFVEAGIYLGIPVTGYTTSDYYSYPSYPGDDNTIQTRRETFEGYFSVSPAVGMGGIFPVSKRIDLFLKPECVFQKNFIIQNAPSPSGYKNFNEHFFYVRGCLGIRINLNEIE